MTELLYTNPNFNPIEFEGVKNKVGANAFTMSPKKWVESTNAIEITQNIIQSVENGQIKPI